ncbi:MAG: response regulator transcription factor [Anaerolineae bacterium]|nr:response regulator transcription factor [Anaerolineae bacterium]
MDARVLIVEDDKDLARLLQISLSRGGYSVHVAGDGRTGFRHFVDWKPDLVMLDVDLPELDGLEVCQRIRDVSEVPILMMTGHAVSEPEIARGLDMGADEYMLKPLGNIELAARIRALLRRSRSDEIEPVVTYSDPYLEVDLAARYVRVNGVEVRLTPTEFKLLATFIRHPGEVLTFEKLLEIVWGREYTSEHHYPRIYVSHLRRKIERDAQQPEYLLNEYGVGYRFTTRES